MIKVTLNDSKGHTIDLPSSSAITVGRGFFQVCRRNALFPINLRFFFFQCQDKRVSRNHGEINILGDQANIKAVRN